MTDPDEGRQPEDSVNGASRGEASSNSEDAGASQTLADGDQTLADTNQTGSDTDQTAADVDQVASDRDQAAADQDQAASDRDLAGGGDPDVHDSSRDVRRRTASQRRLGNQRRSDSAGTRDTVARARDLAAAARDEAAARLDRELDERDATWAAHALFGSPKDADGRASANRDRAAEDRGVAGKARVRAGTDREEAAKDRAAAAEDRREAQADRDALLTELAISETDGLTGARTRAPGMEDLDREIDRARRTTGVLSLAYVDIVGLKAVNDEKGHTAGDALLKAAVRAIQGHLRSYDSIIRIGGDEFLCVIPGAAIETARQRFDSVKAVLAADPSHGEIKVGIAALGPEDSAAELVERADAALPVSPGRKP